MASQAMFSEECMIHDEAVFLSHGFIILCNGTLHFFTPPILVGSCIFNIRFKYNISYIYSMNLSPPKRAPTFCVYATQIGPALQSDHNNDYQKLNNTKPKLRLSILSSFHPHITSYQHQSHYDEYHQRNQQASERYK